jgi:hypothetical protein
MLRRFWPVALVGLLTSVCAGVWIAHRPGVYYEQINVIFIMPATPDSGNALQNGSDNLIRTAGLVARLVTNDWSGPEPVSDSATLLGEGVRSGYSVRLPNAGGQWAYNFDKPQLNVEVVGTTPAEVRSTMTQVLARVNGTLAGLQDSQSVRPSLRIQTRLSPPSASVEYVTGSRARTFAVTVVLELALTLAALFALERWRTGGRRSRDAGRTREPLPA